MREGVFFFRSFYEVAKKIKARQDRVAFYDAILDYAFEGIEPSGLKGYAEIGFISAKPVLDADRQKYINGQKAAGFGKLGGRPRKENNPGGLSAENPLNNKNKKQEQEQEQEQEKGVKKAVAFTAPTLEQVQAYVKEKGYAMDAVRFHAYYTANGWKVGRNPMKNWKAAVVNWAQKDKPAARPTYDQMHPIGDFANEFSTL